MRARFQSRCPRCHKAIREGDEILKRVGDATYSHATCPVDIGTYEVKVEAGSLVPNVKFDPGYLTRGLEDYEEAKATAFDADTLMHQFYDESPFLDMIESKVDRMETLYGKRVTIPMKARSSSETEKHIAELREEADNLEREAKRRRKAQKRSRREAKQREQRREVAQSTLARIAKSGKRDEDRIEAARALLEF